MSSQRLSLMFFSAGIGRTGTFIVIDILIDVIREKGESARCTGRPHLHLLYPDKIQLRFKTLLFILICLSVGFPGPYSSPESGGNAPEAVG